MFEIPLFFVVLLLLIAGSFHFLPGRTRPDLFFAVTIDPDFRRTPEARQIVHTYRVIVWGSALLALALGLITGTSVGAALVLTAGFLVGLTNARRRVLGHSVAPSPIVEIDLTSEPELLPGGPAANVLPLLLFGALALWVHLRWDSLPPRFPIHWGFHGADHWVETTPKNVFGFLILHASTCLLLVAMELGILHWSRRISASGAAAAAERILRRRIMQVLIAVLYFQVCFAGAALLLRSQQVQNFCVLILSVLLLVAVLIAARSAQRLNRAVAADGTTPVGDRTPDACGSSASCTSIQRTLQSLLKSDSVPATP